ncbi:hypothetical protein [Trueperella sp. HMSC08H06]|uniref:hypothetical protein n=1 Tax=Trueperella sp. HMSC08H06 TaxID=1581142 RepID=UPI0008A3A945|nr:hypothetical protein [Trueperella sp. HMSC08H06]OFS67533.1 hypothetical protein HMPREF3174_03655 [Trueperella sp. HMSC08H06]
MARTPESVFYECAICEDQICKINDCDCVNGFHYEGGSIVGFQRLWDNPNIDREDLFGHPDHRMSSLAQVRICWACQERILDLIYDGLINDLIWAEDDDDDDDSYLRSESEQAWQKGWSECADHFEDLLGQTSFNRTPRTVAALLEDMPQEQKLHASITGEVPCPWCDGHLRCEYLQDEIYLVKCSNHCGRTTIVEATSPSDAVHTVALPARKGDGEC